MKNKLVTGLLILGTAATTLLIEVNPANALTIKSTAANRTGAVDVDVDATIEDIANGVKVSLEVDDALNTGDLLSAFFNFNDSTISNLSVTGAAGFRENTDGTGPGGFGGSIGSTFDLGVKLSSTGSSGGSLTSTMFNILGTNLNAADFIGQQFAVRLQSAGLASDPNDREGSSKQLGTFDGDVVPTPAAVLPALFGMGAAAVRKKKNGAEATQEV